MQHALLLVIVALPALLDEQRAPVLADLPTYTLIPL